MGLKRRSRFAMAACLLGANAPDIDVFAPLVLPVDGIAFHRGPVHSVFAVPILAAAITGLLWLLDRLRPNPEALPLRPVALFVVALIAVASHPFLDWLTTYAIALFAPVSWRWYSGNAIFIVDWVYWLLMIAGVSWSAWRWLRHLPHPGRPAQIAGAIMLGYIGLNLAESTWVEHATATELRKRGIEPMLIVAGPPPLTFWNRSIEWRSRDRFGSGSFSPATGIRLEPESQPLGLDDPQLALAERTRRYVRSFLTWSRMPIVIRVDGRAYLTDQRFYDSGRRASSGFFLIPLDNSRTSS
jgi:inner membrane protein